MRSILWSRAVRPKLHGYSPNATLKRVPVTRQTASAPARRGLTLNDVFTLLLTPILATALLADTSWKDKRRKDWAQRIAQVEAETEEIQSRALHSWQALQSRALSLGAGQQRRQFSNSASRPRDIVSLPIEEIEQEPEWFEAVAKERKDSAVEAQDEEGEYAFEPAQQEQDSSDRLRRMLAIKLALNLTIYINTGVSPSKVRREVRIPDWTDDFKYDLDIYQDLTSLMNRMRQLCSSLEDLKLALPEGAVPVKREIMDENSQMLQEEICDISERYTARNLSLPEFITQYTLAVLRSTAAPTSRAYHAMFRGLSKGSGLDQPCHDLAMQTLFTWERSRLPICDYDLCVILTELGRRKHVQKFDGLMRDLTMSPSPINASKWTWERANDVQVPVPISYNPAILMSLIHCALRFDQPQKAEAWSEILRKTWMDINEPTQRTPLQQLFTNWMRYYEVQGNWRKGVAWLDAARKWAISIASFDMYSLQRLTVGMLTLCFACGKSQEYEEILSAVIDSGIPAMNPYHYFERSSRRAISQEWRLLHDETYRTKVDSRTDREKVEAFQSKLSLITQSLVSDKDSADVEWRREQGGKPDPIRPVREEGKSDQSLMEAVESWKLLYSKNQQAIQDAMTVAGTWKERCLAQQRETLSLTNQLRHQKFLVQKLRPLKTQTPISERTETSMRGHTFAPQSMKAASAVTESTDSTTTYFEAGSLLAERKVYNEKNRKFDDTDAFLLPRFVEPGKVDITETAVGDIPDGSLSSHLTSFEKVEMSLGESDKVHEGVPPSHFVTLHPEEIAVVQRREIVSMLDIGSPSQQDNDATMTGAEDNRASEAEYDPPGWSVRVRRVGYTPGFLGCKFQRLRQRGDATQSLLLSGEHVSTV